MKKDFRKNLNTVQIYSIVADVRNKGLMMKPLTSKQQEIFDFILDCIKNENYTPTMREIAEQFGFKSVNSVNDHLTAIERKGYVSRRHGASRGIVVSDEFFDGTDSEDEPGIPILGKTAAGAPITAIENVEGRLELSELYGEEHFALRVEGQSMIDAGIWDGDYVIVRQQPRVENGQIAVAVVDGEATVKRINLKGGEVELIPENENYRPILVDLSVSEFYIAGKVVGVHRVIRS